MAMEQAKSKSPNEDANKMDTNNQMILMRKDIKKAKGIVVAKLLRRAKVMKDKKTKTEEQAKKNQQRAERLVEETRLLKSANPDTIFKQIVVSDWTEEDFMKRSDVTLAYRAHMRIAVIPFIKKKLDPVKKQILKYDEERGKTKTLSYTDMTKELDKTNAEGDNEKIFQVKKLPKKVEASKSTEEVSSKPEPTAEEENKDDEDDEESQPPSSSDEEILSGDDLVLFNPPAQAESLSEEEEEEIATKVVADDITGSVESFSDDEEDEKVPTKIVDTKKVTDDSTTSVEPPKISHPSPVAAPVVVEKPKPLLNEIAKDSKNDDVSFFLENLGEGFRDSDDEDVSSDGVDIVDAESDDDEEDAMERDAFFMGEDHDRADKKKVVSKHDKKKSKSSSKPESTFVKLGKVAKTSNKAASKFTSQDSQAGKKKKKNRPGQRTRQLFLQDRSTVNNTQRTNVRNVKRKGRFDETASAHGGKQIKTDEKSVAEKVHPSWQASQAKKQQCSIQQFQGKRIVFDDSD